MIGDQPFLQRNIIIFLAFAVIFVTLVLQGLTLPPLIRALGLSGAGDSDGEEKEARKTIFQAVLAFLSTTRKAEDQSDFSAIFDDLEEHYRHRLAVLDEGASHDGRFSPKQHHRRLELLRDLLQLERRTAVELRNHGRISDELLRKLERELDLDEARLREKTA